MAVEGKFVGSVDDYEKGTITLGAAVEGGDVLQYEDGRACVVVGSSDIASGEDATVALSGTWDIDATDSIVFIKGCEVWWDESANKAHMKWGAAGDFYVGTAAEDLASGTSRKVKVHLNGKQSPIWSLRDPKGQSNTIVETLGLGLTTNPGGIITAEFDATAEAATASILSGVSVPPTDKFFFQGTINIVDDGDAAALDLNFGIANAAHATDFDSVTEQVTIHTDGGSANILAESDDGTTEVAATDTTVDYALGTPFVVWIHCDDNEDIQIYIDGVNVLPSSVFKLDAATGPMKAVFMMEKTSDDTTAKVDVIDMALIRYDDGGAA